MLLTAWDPASGPTMRSRSFTAPRPSEQIALIVSDYERVNGVLSITRGRVHGTERDATKTGEDRRIELCPQAIAILESHLTWHDSSFAKAHPAR